MIFPQTLDIYWHRALRRFSSSFPIFRGSVLVILWNIWKERCAVKLRDSSCNHVECFPCSLSHPLRDIESRLFFMSCNVQSGHLCYIFCFLFLLISLVFQSSFYLLFPFSNKILGFSQPLVSRVIYICVYVFVSACVCVCITYS